MALKEQLRKRENFIFAGLFLVVLAVFTAVRFDYYYDLNDDVLMKDILAGVYTGTPEGHNIQMLWIISALLSLLYRIVRFLPWYGIFFCVVHFGCLALILIRSLEFVKTRWGKLLTGAVESALFAALFLEHLVAAQYTVTCALMAATAAFLFYTTDGSLPAGRFIKKNIPAVLLVFFAYLLRSEMLLLVLPMICVAGAAKWGSNRLIFTKENFVKYLSVIGLILFGIAAGQFSHNIAYGSDAWRTFTEFFDNRTELYDFQVLPAYEEHREFYESIGLTESEQVLFDNYNFGIDEEIDEKLVGEIADYAAANRSAEKPLSTQIPVKLRDYLYRFLHGPHSPGSDYPWNYAVILGYAAVFITALFARRDGRRNYLKNAAAVSWKLLFLLAVRTVLWMYILLGERAPVRITHSLYLMELCILAAMFLTEWAELEKEWARPALAALTLTGFGVLAALVLPKTVAQTEEDQQLRARENAPYLALYEYFSEGEHEENFYFIDVYSSVSYSEKMFENVDNSLANYDIMGGWACKSPLQEKKLEAFGIDSMEYSLKDDPHVYFVRKKTEDMDWLFDYYEGHGTPVDIMLVDTVADVFEIYSLSGKQ